MLESAGITDEVKNLLASLMAHIATASPMPDTAEDLPEDVADMAVDEEAREAMVKAFAEASVLPSEADQKAAQCEAWRKHQAPTPQATAAKRARLQTPQRG